MRFLWLQSGFNLGWDGRVRESFLGRLRLSCWPLMKKQRLGSVECSTWNIEVVSGCSTWNTGAFFLFIYGSLSGEQAGVAVSARRRSPRAQG